MSSKLRKRSRPAPDAAAPEGTFTDETLAHCPFNITISPEAECREGNEPKAKKKKQESFQTQNTVFQPEGKFRTSQSLKLCYVVNPNKQWLNMTRFNSFILNGNRYHKESFVYVENEATMERQSSLLDGASKASKKADYRVAWILDVRASDEHHVYALVSWMYWPEELPPGTLDGERQIVGRQPYHGRHELVASNHMDVINVVSVLMSVNVKQWVESNGNNMQESLYWRQAFNCTTSEISSVTLICKCKTPANPDKRLVGCSNKMYERWMHYDCLLEDVLTRVYDRLRPDISHKLEKSAVKDKMEEDIKDEPKEGTKEHLPHRLLSPSFEREDRKSPTATNIEIKNEALVNRWADESSQGTETPTPTPQTPSIKPSKSTLIEQAKLKKSSEKPWEGLFEATFKMNEGPTV